MSEIIKICEIHGDLSRDKLHRQFKKSTGKEYFYCAECLNIKNKEHRYKKLNILKQKYCKNCGPILEKDVDKWGRCIPCRREHNKYSYHKRNAMWPSKQKDVMRARYNTDKFREYRIRHEAKLGEKYTLRRRERQSALVAALGDDYVKGQIIKKYGFKRKEIPLEMVEIYRVLLQIHRIRKNANNSKDL